MINISLYLLSGFFLAHVYISYSTYILYYNDILNINTIFMLKSLVTLKMVTKDFFQFEMKEAYQMSEWMNECFHV